MHGVTGEILSAYLDDSLSDTDIARVEGALRQFESLRKQLALLQQERDRGDHSVGAIWRRERLTCIAREQLGSYLLDVLEPEHQDYVRFHLEVIACPFCQANLQDIKTRQAESSTVVRRRKRYFDSSAGLLKR